MEKDVRIIIKGLHDAGYDKSDVVLDVIGTYYNKNGKHYICYKETDEHSGESYNSIIKMQPDNIELIKRGSGAAHLYFEKGKLNNSHYKTVMGSLFIGIDTKYIDFNESTDEINARIEYTLVVEEEKAADCIVEIKICKEVSNH